MSHTYSPWPGVNLSEPPQGTNQLRSPVLRSLGAQTEADNKELLARLDALEAKIEGITKTLNQIFGNHFYVKGHLVDPESLLFNPELLPKDQEHSNR
jgi:hypothetical protein